MEFTKMEACGNDFVVFNGLKTHINDYRSLAINACHRNFSVGANGILVVEKSQISDIQMIYYNSDGSRGEMCGNGIRCFSKYVYEEGIVQKKEFTVETIAGIKTVWLEVDEHNKVISIKVNMGKPILDTKLIPVDIDNKKAIEETIEVDGQKYIFSSLLVGVPHTIIFTEDIDKLNINELGRKIEINPIFPKKTNVNFVRIVNKRSLNIYTWERGAGRTLGCGTGSCASVVIGYLTDRLEKEVLVRTEGGVLEVSLDDDLEIFMKGGANRICNGVLLI